MPNYDQMNNHEFATSGGYNYNNPTKLNYGDVVEIMGKKYSIVLMYGKPELHVVQDRLEALEERVEELEKLLTIKEMNK